MNKQVINFLKSYSYEPNKIDRLIVSAFVLSNNIKDIKNNFINQHLISEKDNDIEYLKTFLKLVKLDSFENLIEAFEFVVSPKDKIVTGAVYTPINIREYIVHNIVSKEIKLSELKICDPACGCGGFLYTAAKHIKAIYNIPYKTIFANHLYGLDIQNYSVKRTKLLLTLLALSEGENHNNFNFNFFQGNALSFDWRTSLDNFSGFTHIVGNPPYVCSRNIDDESKKLLANWKVCSTGHPDLYIPFFEIGVTNLRPNGILGYITMNTFFKSVNGRALREYFKENKFDFRIIDFGGNQVFQTKSTYTCICTIKKSNSTHLKYTKINDIASLQKPLTFHSIEYSTLDSIKGWNLQNTLIINKIEATGTSLGKLFKTRNGIATLKNDVYIFEPIKSDKKFHYLRDGKDYPIEKEICRDVFNPNKLINTANINSLKQKIIFPYFFEEENIKIYSEVTLKNKFPFAYKYLLTKKNALAERDKGKGKYEKWYAYGRNQSLEKLRKKLFFPHIAPVIPNYVINTDENLLFHNGMAIISDDRQALQLLQKLLSSRLFWFYITNASKPYGSGYYSLSRNYIKSFGVYNFLPEEIKYIIDENDSKKLNDFIERKYDIKL